MANPPTAASALLRIFQRDTFRDFFHALAESMNYAFFILQRDGRRILTFNHAFLLATGYSRSDLDDLSPATLFPGELGQRALAQLVDLEEGPELRIEDVPLQTYAGSIKMVDLQARATRPNSGWILVWVSLSAERKIEEIQRRARQKRLGILLQISQALLEGTLTALPQALGRARELFDASACGLYRGAADGPRYFLEGDLPAPFPQVQPATELRPLPRAGLWTRGQRPEHALHRAARASGFHALAIASIGSRTAWIGALVVGWRDPERVPDDIDDLMDIVANLCHAALQLGTQQATVADLGKWAEQLEAESENQLAAISDALLALDEDLIVARTNPAAHEMLGYAAGELRGQRIQDVLVGPEDILATILDAVGHNRPSERSRITLHRRDGTPIPVRLRAVPLESDAKSRSLVILSDQSEQKQFEDQTESLTQRALLGEVTAIFAHEVRNPINNISTGVQLVASRLGEDHPLRGTLERVRRECVRLDQLMEDVLFYSRPLELKMEPLKLGDSIHRLLARWEPRLNQANVRWHVDMGDGDFQIKADPRTWEQVLVNLISNAVEAMTEGGTLSFSAELIDTPHGELIELRVADTGPGIPKELLERLFDPFFTTKKEGTGLGLAISRRIVAAHQGSIAVESYPDAGTVFILRVPALNGSPREG